MNVPMALAATMVFMLPLLHCLKQTKKSCLLGHAITIPYAGHEVITKCRPCMSYLDATLTQKPLYFLVYTN